MLFKDEWDIFRLLVFAADQGGDEANIMRQMQLLDPISLYVQ